DDDAPDTSNSHVVGIEDTTYTFKSSDFNVVGQDSSNLTIVITSEPASGTLYYLDGNLWVELTGSVIGADGYEITQSEIDSGKLVFVPISDESSTSMLDDEGTSGNNLGDYTEFNFYASDGVNVSGGSIMSIDISAVADAPTLTVNSDNVTAAIDFDDTNYSGSWGSVNINQVFGPGTVGEWHSSNGNRVEVGRESTYRSGGDSTNTVLEIEYYNVDDVVYTDIDVEQGQYYSFSFDISGRYNSISNGNSDLNVVWINMDTGQETVLYEFRPNDEDWLRDQTVVLPSDVGGNYRLLLVSADTQASSSVGAILDNLEIVKADSQGFEDSFIALPDFEAALNDIDSSEVLSLSLSGLPIGTQITDGSVTLVVTSNSGVDISSLDMDNLSVIVDVPGVYNYSITATATEVSNSDTASITADLVLTVLELPQRPDVGTSEARIVEEGLLTGLQDDISDVNSEGDIVDHVRLNHYGHSSEELLWSQNPAGKDNQKVDGHKDGIVIDVGAAGDDVFLGEGDDTLYLGDSHTTLDNNANSAASINAANNDMKAFMSGGDLEHLQSPSDENSALNSLQFSSAHIDVGHSGAGGDHVYGQGGVDIIYGAAGNDVLDGGEGNDGLRGGSGEDRLTGGSGEDILIGGLGDDILTGGGDDDIFKFVDQDTSNSKIDIRNGEQDIITDFTKGEDKIDISDLLHTDSNDTIDSLLQANKVGLTLEASDNLSNADLKLTINDGGNSQEVIIQGVGSQFSDYIESGSITNVSGLLNDIINIPDINN
ncbi:hypothetical protein BCT65_018960, partial [Vibrio splendidus]